MAPQIAIYLRHDDGEALCREYGMLYYGAAKEDFVLYRDAADLSAKSTGGRSALLRDAQDGKLRAALTAELGEMCRGAEDFLELSRQFEQAGVPLVFVRERLDTASATGRTVCYAAELFLHLERRSTALSIRDHMRSLARSGYWLGGVTPTGYVSTPAEPVVVAGKPHKAYRLDLVEEQAALIRRIYSDFLRLDSLAKVVRALEDEGVRTKNGRAFSRFTIRQILENPVYMRADKAAWGYFSEAGAQLCAPRKEFDGSRGLMVYNKTAQTAGKSNKQREIAEWIVAVGQHEGLVSGADWLEAQARLDANKPGTERKPKSETALLAGLLSCGYCDAHLRPKLTRRHNADGELIYAYLCEYKERTHSQECDLPNLNGNRADRAVLELLRTLDPGAPGVLPGAETQAPPDGLSDHQQRLGEKRAQYEQLQQQISALVFSLISAIDKKAYDYIIREIDGLHRQSAKLDAEIRALAALSGDGPARVSPAENAAEMLARIQAPDFEAADVVQRRAALRAVIRAAQWDGAVIALTLAGGAEYEVPLGE